MEWFVIVALATFCLLFWIRQVLKAKAKEKKPKVEEIEPDPVRQCVIDLVESFVSKDFKEYNTISGKLMCGDDVRDRVLYIKKRNSYKFLCHRGENINFLYFTEKPINPEYEINTVATYLNFSRYGLMDLNKWNVLRMASNKEVEYVCSNLNPKSSKKRCTNYGDDCDKVTEFIEGK